MNIQITSTHILPIENGLGGCVGIAQVVINDAIKLTGLKLIEKNGKRFVSYPRNSSNKQKRAFCYPVTAEVGNYFSDTLWAEYDRLVNA